ncbi:MAG: alpha/beta hydrolase [Chakrabartia sp.]
MDHITPPQWVTRPDGIKIAFRHVSGNAPTILFLPGYASDMLGSKAQALERWAVAQNRAFLRLDYSGCGESEGTFEAGTLDRWRDDALLIINNVIQGPVILVGSSMGGWLMLLIALAKPDKVMGLIGIAAAPDFTDWGFTSEEKDVIRSQGALSRPSDYGPEPMITTKAFWQSGREHCILSAEMPIDCPVRLIHGQSDPDVPWHISIQLADRLRSSDVQVHIIKDGDHRLSREQDIAVLISTLDHMMKAL